MEAKGSSWAQPVSRGFCFRLLDKVFSLVLDVNPDAKQCPGYLKRKGLRKRASVLRLDVWVKRQGIFLWCAANDSSSSNLVPSHSKAKEAHKHPVLLYTITPYKSLTPDKLQQSWGFSLMAIVLLLSVGCQGGQRLSMSIFSFSIGTVDVKSKLSPVSPASQCSDSPCAMGLSLSHCCSF